MNIEEATSALKDFLTHNKYSAIELHEKSQTDLVVARPWNDKSLFLHLSEDQDELFEALNNVILPERFTAIWHRDSGDFEVIYTAWPLEGSQAELVDRSFTFSFRGKSYQCKFAPSSPRLLTIAKNSEPIGPSSTDHRNLRSYQYFIETKNDPDKPEFLDLSPVSFWVSGVQWDDESVVDLARHLNFYMSYYDFSSPAIIIHPPKQESTSLPRTRYIAQKFPQQIEAEELSSNLMHFWEASKTGDVFRRFLYCYQILEYSSYYSVEDNIRRSIRKVLTTPHRRDEMDSMIIKIIDHVAESKVWEGNKLESLLRAVVDCRLVWNEIQKHREYFLNPIQFDGGFHLRPLIVEKSTFETFAHDWYSRFAQTIRSIRNALSHGKEQSMSSVITPTYTNFYSLRPWGHLISIVAGEVVVYQKVNS